MDRTVFPHHDLVEQPGPYNKYSVACGRANPAPRPAILPPMRLIRSRRRVDFTHAHPDVALTMDRLQKQENQEYYAQLAAHGRRHRHDQE